MSERQAPSYQMHVDWQEVLRKKRMFEHEEFTKNGGWSSLENDLDSHVRWFFKNHAAELNRIMYGQEIQK